MTDITGLDRVKRLQQEAAVRGVEAEVLGESLNESTGASWFWAFLFGPLYFAVHRFWGRALIVFALNPVIIGIIVAPFLAYPAWKERAKSNAEKMLLLDSIRRA